MGLNIGHTADWHLGHSRVPTADTIHDIKKHLFSRLNELQLLFVVGDIFDGTISFNSKDGELIIEFFAELLKQCYEHDVTIRVIRGTFSHDNNQLNIWEKICCTLGIPVDFKLVNDLHIEHIKKYNIHVLYMPDNLPYKSKHDVFVQIHRLLTVHGIQQVDYIAMHGEFEHMNFGFVNHHAYSSEDFAGLYRHFILCGHIHKPNQHKNVIYAGSFNRLAHNEEEAKGFWTISNGHPAFVTNTDATLFVTVDYNEEQDIDIILSKHEQILSRFSTERKGFVRVIMNDPHLKQALSSYHGTIRPNVRLTFKKTHYHNEQQIQFLQERLQHKQNEILEIPSIKNISIIVIKHLQSQGIVMDLKTVERIINSDSS